MPTLKRNQTNTRMEIILDERETTLYDKCMEILPKFDNSLRISKKVLPLGDILLQDLQENVQFIIERKSLSDLVASIKDGRYEEQSYRLIHSSDLVPGRILYVIEGMFSQIRNPQEKKMIYSGMTSLSVFKGFSVFRTCSLTETAEWIMHLTDKIVRDMKKGKQVFYSLPIVPVVLPVVPTTEDVTELVKEEGVELQEKTSSSSIPANYCTVVKKVKKDNITKENMGEIILCQIPGISSQTAMAIMNHCNHSFLQLIETLKTDPKSLENIMINKKKISKTAIEKMTGFLLV